jgi:hypothetical protein
MKRAMIFASVLGLVLPVMAAAQDAQPAPADGTSEKASGTVIDTQPAAVIQHMRPNDKRGLYIFESPKEPGAAYGGFKLDWGAAFTQQYQALDHNNAAAAKVDATGKNLNELIPIGAGFNNAVANLYLNAQLARGIRVAMTSYLSARHHQESWVKDGYMLIDASPIDNPILNTIMNYTTLKIGHYEINYGDAHFRRTDNGNSIYNPFVGNLIMDAFTTEIGGEAYVRKGALLGMVGITAGESSGKITSPDDRGWVKMAKLGVDKQVNQDLRVRLTGSYYTTDQSTSNTLYSGDRGGSRYYLVLENINATTKDQAWSGNLQPGFKNSVSAWQVNPFVKFHGLELFGVVESASGKWTTETADRTFNQYAIDGVYRLFNEKVFVAGRYNTVDGRLKDMTNDVSVDRWQASAGWYITPSLMMKGEYVTQKYNDFPTTDIRHNGKFDGFLVEGAVSF